ncbi:MAG: flagellar biosynthetic protein FliR [Thermoguttaceae bacterium]
MNWLYLIDTSRVLVFALVLTRVSGIVIAAPVFGGSDIPLQFRALLSFCLAILIMPSQWFLYVQEPSSLPGFVLYIGGELLIGLSIGLGINFLFTAMFMAGDMIGRIGGLTSSQLFDPTSGEQVPLLGRFLQLLGVTAFACAGGLRLLMAALLDTFETIPVGDGLVRVTVAQAMISIVSVTFGVAFRIAAPATVGILIAMTVMGVLGRTLPQLNLMSVGFGINTIIMFVILFFSIGTAVYCFQERFVYVLELLFDSFHTPLQTEWIE